MERRHDGLAGLKLLRAELLDSGNGRRLREDLRGGLALLSSLGSASVLQKLGLQSERVRRRGGVRRLAKAERLLGDALLLLLLLLRSLSGRLSRSLRSGLRGLLLQLSLQLQLRLLMLLLSLGLRLGLSLCLLLLLQLLLRLLLIPLLLTALLSVPLSLSGRGRSANIIRVNHKEYTRLGASMPARSRETDERRKISDERGTQSDAELTCQSAVIFGGVQWF